MGVLSTSNKEDVVGNVSTFDKDKEMAMRQNSQSELSLYTTADDENRETANCDTPKPSISLSNDAISEVASTTSTIKDEVVTGEGAEHTTSKTTATGNGNSETNKDTVTNGNFKPHIIGKSMLLDDVDDVNADGEREDGVLSNHRSLRNEKKDTIRVTEEFTDSDRTTSTRDIGDLNGIDIDQLDWDDANDKDDPKNWPVWKKWYITFTVAGVCLSVSLGSSLYVSGVPEIQEKLGCSREIALLGLTLYLIGLALGPVFAAPLSEMFGRKWIYIVTLPLSMLFAMGVGLSQNIHSILIQRFFCGLFGGPALAVSGGSISDIWPRDQIGIAMALFCLAPFLGPVLGPVIGNFAAEQKGWRFTLWVSLMFSGAALILVVFLPETYKRKILQDRYKKRGIKVSTANINFKLVAVMCVTKPIVMLLTDPIVFFFSFYIAFIFAVLFGFFEAFPIIFLKVYKMDQGPSGLPFLGVGIGLILGVVFFIFLDKFVVFKKNPDGTRGKRDENGEIIWDPPEKKLALGQIGSIFLPISLFWMGWTSKELIHWISSTLSGIFFGFGLILIFFMCMLYFSMAFPPANLASALAANNFLRYLLASVFPLFTVQLYEKLHIDWATSLFAFISLALIPVPFVFAKYGAQFRAKSKYGFEAYSKCTAQKPAKVPQESTKETMPEPTEQNIFESDVSLLV